MAKKIKSSVTLLKSKLLSNAGGTGDPLVELQPELVALFLAQQQLFQQIGLTLDVRMIGADFYFVIQGNLNGRVINEQYGNLWLVEGFRIGLG